MKVFAKLKTNRFDEPIAVLESNPKLIDDNKIRNSVQRDSSSESTDMIADENISDSSPDIQNANPFDNNSNAVNTETNKQPNEFEIYYYDSKANEPKDSNENAVVLKTQGSKTGDDDKITVMVKKIEDPIEILFARAEALHAHGRTLEACHLAVKLAEELLSNPPNLLIETPSPPARGKRNRRFNPVCHQVSLLASATLSKAAFLCSVLGENSDYHYLAFRVGLFGLEMARPPASTKALEVKLANQEQDLVLLLKRIPLSHKMMQIVREKAEQFRDGVLTTRGDALLPLMLASYIFDALVLSYKSEPIARNKCNQY